jgi:hypothetical protein
VFEDAKPVLQAYTLRQRREIFDGINGLTAALIPVSAVLTQHHIEAARRRAVETWWQRNGVVNITKSQRVLPTFPEKTPHNYRIRVSNDRTNLAPGHDDYALSPRKISLFSTVEEDQLRRDGISWIAEDS